MNRPGLDMDSGVGGSGLGSGNPDLDLPPSQYNSANSKGGGFDPWSLAVPAAVAVGNWFSSDDANEANSAEAAANRAFAAQQAGQARDYDQAKTIWQATHGYQNAVEDMRKAGLNPAMMYAGKGGAESGSGGGGSAASAPGNPIHTNAIGQALNSAMQSATVLNELRNTNADIAMKQAQAFNATASANYAASNARMTDEELAQLVGRRKKVQAENIRDEGDAKWEDANRTARMLTSKAGIGAATISSAAALDKHLVKMVGDAKGQQPWEKDAELKRLQRAGLRGIPVTEKRFNFKTGRME